MKKIWNWLLCLGLLAVLLPAAAHGAAEEGALSVAPEETTLEPGESVTLTASGLPKDVEYSDVSWDITSGWGMELELRSSQSDPLRVTVTGSTPGEDEITCTVKRNSGWENASAVVRVSGILLQEADEDWSTGGFIQAMTLPAGSTGRFLPQGFGNADWKEYTVASDNPAVATAEMPGIITAVSPGTATVTVTAPSFDRTKSYTAKCTVTVTEASGDTGETDDPGETKTAVTAVSLTLADVTVERGDAAELAAVVTPAGAPVTDVVWKSDNPFVAAVAASGSDKRICAVTGVSPGEANITCTVDGIVSAAAVVRVSGVTLEQSRLTMNIGQQAILEPQVYGAAAAVLGSNWHWTSSDAAVASVGASTGEITANREGTAVITYSTISLTGYAASCTVTVRMDEKTTVRVTLNEAALDFSTLISRLEEICYTATQQELFYLTDLTVSTQQAALYEGWISEASPGTEVYGFEEYYNNNIEKWKAENLTSKGTTGTEERASEEFYGITGDYPRLDNLSLVPKSGFSGTCTVRYTGYSVGLRRFTGFIVVTVSNRYSASSSLVYTIGRNGYVRMERDGFIRYCWQITTRDLRYVSFELPDTRYGRLMYRRTDNRNYYYDSYTGTYYSDEGGIYLNGSYYESEVEELARFYPYSTPVIDEVYFVPNTGYNGTFNLPFSGEDIEGQTFAGSIRITVGSGGTTYYGSQDINYSVNAGEELRLSSADFSRASYNATGVQLDRIRFSSVPSNSSLGTLFQSNGIQAASSTNYFYSGSNLTIDGMYFRAGLNASGTFSASYTGYNTRNESFSGTVRITVNPRSYYSGASTSYSSSNNVSYSVVAGRELTLSPADFSRVSYSATGYELSYITLGSLPGSAQGTLYYSGAVIGSSGGTYYRSGTGRTIGSLTFVAAPQFTGTVTIPYTGCSERNQSFGGNIVISVSAAPSTTSSGSTSAANAANAATIRYFTGGVSARLLPSDFTNAARGYLTGTLTTVRFTVPSTDQGRLCAGYVSPTRYEPVVSGRDYSFSNLEDVVFQPHAGYRGTVNIPYILSASNGGTYAGTVTVQVEPLTASLVFTDMTAYGWAAQAVDFLQNYGILTGTSASAYSPGSPTRRCDYVLMLSRAFSFPDAGLSSFADVSPNSYYAAAVASAKSMGIAAGDEWGRFRPNDTITRQEAATLLYRTMQKNNLTAPPDGTSADLARFSDRDQIAAYAVTPMASLVKLGVFTGDDQNRLNPRAYLTRAEMAAIFYRAIT